MGIFGNGGTNISQSTNGWDLNSDEGIIKSTLAALISLMGVSEQFFLQDILNLPDRAINNKSKDRLDMATSSHVMYLCKVVIHASEVFEDVEKARQWLNTANGALCHLRPVQLFGTIKGIATVDQILFRIENGVYT